MPRFLYIGSDSPPSLTALSTLPNISRLSLSLPLSFEHSYTVYMNVSIPSDTTIGTAI
jgi:hypothetical protein